MPKMKSNRGAMKRFKKTASGRIKFRRAYRNHILTRKTTKVKRKLRSGALVASSDAPAVKRMMIDK